MTDSTRQLVSLVLVAAAFGWWLGVEVWRGRSNEHSARVFWLHLTAPVVAIVLMLAAMWLLANTERIRRQRGLASRAAQSEYTQTAPFSGDAGGVAAHRTRETE